MNRAHRSGLLAGHTAPRLLGVRGTPRRLGVYPRPRLHVVGVPARTGSPRPTNWPSPSPALSYGVDYSFLRHLRRAPVRWPTDAPIVVRLRSADEDADTTLATVVAEIRDLSGLDIHVGAPLGSEEPLGPPRPMEIRVAYLVSAGHLAEAIGPRPGAGTCSGRPILSSTGGHYAGGLVFIDVRRPSAATPPAETIGVLRHDLGHALGLGHAHRRSLVMYAHGPLDRDWGPGDRLGLRLAGQGRGPLPQPPTFRPSAEEQQ